MKEVYCEDTNLNTFEISSRMIKHDPRIHLILYFISPEVDIKKFDIYAMMQLQKYAHILPVIGRADCRRARDIVSLKLDLVSMAHLNKLSFFDLHASLSMKLQDYGEKVLNYFIEDKNGPCPPYSVVTFEDAIIEKNDKGTKDFKYGRKFHWGICNSLEDWTSDLVRLYKGTHLDQTHHSCLINVK